VARAAVERRKASAPRFLGALPRGSRLVCAACVDLSAVRGDMDGVPFGAPPPLGFFGEGGEFFGRALQGSGASAPREGSAFFRPREAGEEDHAKRGGGGMQQRG